LGNWEFGDDDDDGFGEGDIDEGGYIIGKYVAAVVVVLVLCRKLCGGTDS